MSTKGKGKAEPPSAPRYQPELWQNTIDAAVQNGLVDIAVLTISTLLDAHYLPSPHNAQLLLYLAMNGTQSTTAPAPLAILHHLRSLHTARDVAGLLPHIVPPRERIRRGHDVLPPWLLWVLKDAGSPVKGRLRGALSPLERAMEKAVRGCVNEGVWEMLWDEGEDDDEDEEEEEEEEEMEGSARRRRLRPGAWDVLDFLAALWTQEDAYEDGTPVLFLQQLKKPYSDRLADDASAPLAVVAAAFGLGPRPEPAPLGETIRRRATAARLVGLLFSAAAPPAAFLPSALRSGLLQMMRHAPAANLHLFLSAVPKQHWAPLAHVLGHAIEDAAGVRNAPGRSGARRMATGALVPPDVEHALELALLPPRSADGRARIAVLKAALLMLLVTHTEASRVWSRAADESFVTAAADGDVALTAVLRLAARKGPPA